MRRNKILAFPLQSNAKPIDIMKKFSILSLNFYLQFSFYISLTMITLYAIPSHAVFSRNAQARVDLYLNYRRYFQAAERIHLSELVGPTRSKTLRCNFMLNYVAIGSGGRTEISPGSYESYDYASVTGSYVITSSENRHGQSFIQNFTVESCSIVEGPSERRHNCDNHTSFWDGSPIGTNGNEVYTALHRMFSQPTGEYNPGAFYRSVPSNSAFGVSPVQLNETVTTIRRLGDHFYVRAQTDNVDQIYGVCVEN